LVENGWYNDELACKVLSMTVAEITNEVIQNRRSIFQPQFSGERVDDAIVSQMLSNANWAPTHKFTEPWRFIVFTENGLDQLATSQAELYKRVTTADGTFKENRYENLLKKPKLSSHIIAVAMKRDETKRVPEVEEIGAVFCAVQNILLTAYAHGIGCYLSTGGVTYFPEAKELFELGPEDRLIGFLHVGTIKGDVPAGKRTPIEEKVNWIR
jgi:nitroreductase